MKKILVISAVIILAITFVILQKIGFLDNSSTITPSSTGSLNNPNSSITTTPAAQVAYKDGSYTGDVTDAFYGPYQVKAIITNGKISDIQFLQTPSDAQHSREVSAFANPALKQEAIASQNANVDIVSGATQTSLAFRQSLQSALNQAM